jgi:hypothetical protein
MKHEFRLSHKFPYHEDQIGHIKARTALLLCSNDREVHDGTKQVHLQNQKIKVKMQIKQMFEPLLI